MTATGTSTRPALSAPPSAAVPRNRWDLLDVPPLGQWTPTRTVSVVLPHYRAPEALELTLAALANQTYPAELLEVIVADDGSPELPEVDASRYPMPVRVVTQERRGFGLARARNTGARAATGEILVFLDCDMVPERQCVEAHARHHHVVGDAVVVGRRWHVEFDGVTAETLAAAVAAGDVRGLFDGREISRPEWLENHFARTGELTSDHDDLFRLMSGGNLSVRPDTLWRIGGNDETFTQWGAEDTEAAYRYFIDGDLFVSEPAAVCWHQGEGAAPSASEQASLEDQRARLSHLIAHRGFRRSVAGRAYATPRVAVVVPVGPDDRRDAVQATVESLLAGTFGDLHVHVEVADDHPDAVWLGRSFGPDPRVDVAAAVDLQELAPFAPIRLHVPVGVQAGPDSVAGLVGRLEQLDDPVGVAHVTVPGRPSGAPLPSAILTRAANRATRVAADRAAQAAAADASGAADVVDGPAVGTDAVQAVAAELFGEAWLAGSALGFGSAEVAPTAARTPAATAGAVTADPSSPEVVEVWRLFSQLAPAERGAAMSLARTVMTRTSPRQRTLLLAVAKRLLLVLETLGGLGSVRSPRGLFRALVRVLRALLPDRVYDALRAAWRGLRSRS